MSTAVPDGTVTFVFMGYSLRAALRTEVRTVGVRDAPVVVRHLN